MTNDRVDHEKKTYKLILTSYETYFLKKMCN